MKLEGWSTAMPEFTSVIQLLRSTAALVSRSVGSRRLGFECRRHQCASSQIFPPFSLIATPERKPDNEHDRHQGWHRDLLQGLGQRSGRNVLSRLAAEF